MQKGYKMTKIFLATAVIGLLLSGCADKSLTSQQSGFLDDYSDLKPSPYQAKALLYMAPDVDFASYVSVMVEPVKIMANNEQIKADTGLMKEMSEYMNEKVRNRLDKNPNIKLVTKPEGKTAKVEFAITAATVSHDERETYQYVPVALVITEAARATGISQKNVRVVMELRITDANTGKSLLKVMDSQAGEKVTLEAKDLTLEHLKPMLDYWAKRVSTRLDHFKAKAAK